MPYAISDRDPGIYNWVEGMWEVRTPRDESSFTIGIHVRIGDVHAVESFRMMPNDYFRRVAVRVVKELVSGSSSANFTQLSRMLTSKNE